MGRHRRRRTGRGPALSAAAAILGLVSLLGSGAALGTGSVTDELGANRAFTVAAVQSDGKVVAAGKTLASSLSNLQQGLLIARFREDGRLDQGFGGGDGVVVEDRTVEPVAIAIRSSGEIVLAARSVLLRYRDDGSPDERFGDRGVVNTGMTILDIAPMEDGKLVAVGVGENDSGSRVARFHPEGGLDSSWGEDGVVDVGLSAGTIEVQPDGKVLLGGNGVARLGSNGALDPTFGGDGVAEPAPGELGFSNLGVSDIAVQPDGKVVASGGYGALGSVKGGFKLGLARYRTDGTLDPAFGGGDGQAEACGGRVAVREDGTILTASFHYFYLPANCIRLLGSDGRAIGGFVISDGPNHEPWIFDVQPDGTVLAGGCCAWVARYTIDRGLDRRFGHALLPEALCGGRTATGFAKRWVEDPETVSPGAIGTRRRDILIGTEDHDVLKGRAGDDVVCSRAGNDRIRGEKGADKLIAGAGADRVRGGGGADRLFGGLGSDLLLGGDGNDFLAPGAGRDRVFGGRGKDRVIGVRGRS